MKAATAIEEVQKIDEKVKIQTSFIRSLTVDAEILISKAKGESTKAECKKVYEAIRYSDPMSNSALASIESEITIKFAKLSETIADDHVEAASALANEILVLISDRNKKCRMLK
jgi:tellurite resistance protein